MKLHLDYGKQGLDVDLPDKNVASVLDLAPVAPLADPSAAVRAALARPIGTRPLAEIAAGRRNACIVVCDITRPVPNWVVLPEILTTLAWQGITGAKVTILIATGTHRPSTDAEIAAMLGEKVLATGCRVVNHVCWDDAGARYLGSTPNHVPVFLNRVYLDADLKITCGLIEPHFMAGYSGGRKLIMPGIAALKTVQAWHSPRFLEHPNATNGVTRGNPVHEENTLIASMARPDLIADVVLDTQRRITGVFAGDMVEAWEKGVEFVRGHARVSAPAAVDVVVTTSAGHPLDLTYYQTVKGMVGALPIVKPGGHVIIASQCAEGIGGPDFSRTLLETDDLQRLVEDMQQPDWTPIPEQWQIEELAKATRYNPVACVCDGIPSETLSKLFVTPAASVEDAVASALSIHGQSATIAVIPKGPYIIPYIAAS
ncbi:MAG: nickel-dependent lactate racemase [Capsulimonadaceae bacterium]|nr:nickel-dependent lactate racemase [Capsulimonadaceae bacterium]